MNSLKRVLINTIAQYIRTFLNIVLALYSTRIVLATLGSTDFGLYSVIAGVVSMLSFATNTFLVTTQRFLSFYHGKNDKQMIKKIFANSVFIHLCISVIVVAVLLSVTSLVINHLLTIPEERIIAATRVYQTIVVIICFTIFTCPFKALFVARENIVYISIIDVIDGVLKVVIAILLSVILYDRLITYGLLLIGIAVFNFLAYSVYAFVKYEECHVPSLKSVEKKYVKQLLGFASWTLIHVGCVIGRTQGIAVVINNLFTATLNASYGISQQVLGALASLSSSITNAMSPQIIKAEGGNQRKKMLRLSGLVSKYGFIILSVAAIPIIYEYPFILKKWLGNVPDGAIMFCRFITISALVDQLTVGLGTANKAIGDIKVYSILFGILKILTIPLCLILLYCDYNPLMIMISFLSMEVISSFSRILFLKNTAKLSIKSYALHILYPALTPVIAAVFCCFLINYFMDWNYRIILLLFVSTTVICSISYMMLSSSEKVALQRIIKKK
jgi:O-antigen/teichoic acid export membrane protein